MGKRRGVVPPLIFALCTATAGCAGLGGPTSRAPKTLFTWSETGELRCDPATPGGAQADGGDETKASGKRPEEEPLVADRPDFTEASSTVGKGRAQLEAGYTYTRDRSGVVTTTSHSYPEALLRVGVFAEWFELRIGQNFGNARSGSPNDVFSSGGAEDLYLGVKLGLTEQKGARPEMALVIQSQVPTGHPSVTAGRVLPGANLLYGWDVIEDRLTLGGSTQASGAIDKSAHGYVEFAQSLTAGFPITKRFAAYTEWFAFFPAGAATPGVGPQHYLDGGFTYRLSPNFQLDLRAGCGLNRSAANLFAGSGFAVRY